MEKPTKVMVNNTQEFNLNFDVLSNLDIIKESNATFHLLYKQKAFRAQLLNSDFDKRIYTISINSNTYHIQIQSPLDDLIKSMGYSMGSSKVQNTIIAPMPGIIIDLNVKEGQQVKKGDILLILEAMKMENAIICPKDALIKKVSVSIGDTVDKNKLLVEIE